MLVFLDCQIILFLREPSKVTSLTTAFHIMVFVMLRQEKAVSSACKGISWLGVNFRLLFQVFFLISPNMSHDHRLIQWRTVSDQRAKSLLVESTEIKLIGVWTGHAAKERQGLVVLCTKLGGWRDLG